MLQLHLPLATTLDFRIYVLLTQLTKDVLICQFLMVALPNFLSVDLIPLLFSFAITELAELGDKTQLVVIALKLNITLLS